MSSGSEKKDKDKSKSTIKRMWMRSVTLLTRHFTEKKEKSDRKSRSGSVSDKDKKAKQKSTKTPPITQLPTSAAQTMSPTPTRTAPTEAAKKKDKTSK